LSETPVREGSDKALGENDVGPDSLSSELEAKVTSKAVSGGVKT